MRPGNGRSVAGQLPDQWHRRGPRLGRPNDEWVSQAGMLPVISECFGQDGGTIINRGHDIAVVGHAIARPGEAMRLPVFSQRSNTGEVRSTEGEDQSRREGLLVGLVPG